MLNITVYDTSILCLHVVGEVVFILHMGLEAVRDFVEVVLAYTAYEARRLEDKARETVFNTVLDQGNSI